MGFSGHARHAAFRGLIRRTIERPLRTSQTSRAAPSRVECTNRSNSAPTRISNAPEAWVGPTIAFAGRPHYRIRGYAQLSATWRNDTWRPNAAPSPCSNSETAEVKSSILGKFTTYSGYGGVDMVCVKSRHKLPEFMAAVTITINFTVMAAPVGDTFSTVTR
jgi:hypothetical protein